MAPQAGLRRTRRGGFLNPIRNAGNYLRAGRDIAQGQGVIPAARKWAKRNREAFGVDTGRAIGGLRRAQGRYSNFVDESAGRLGAVGRGAAKFLAGDDIMNPPDRAPMEVERPSQGLRRSRSPITSEDIANFSDRFPGGMPSVDQLGLYQDSRRGPNNGLPNPGAGDRINMSASRATPGMIDAAESMADPGRNFPNVGAGPTMERAQGLTRAAASAPAAQTPAPATTQGLRRAQPAPAPAEQRMVRDSITGEMVPALRQTPLKPGQFYGKLEDQVGNMPAGSEFGGDAAYEVAGVRAPGGPLRRGSFDQAFDSEYRTPEQKPTMRGQAARGLLRRNPYDSVIRDRRSPAQLATASGASGLRRRYVPTQEERLLSRQEDAETARFRAGQAGETERARIEGRATVEAAQAKNKPEYDTISVPYTDADGEKQTDLYRIDKKTGNVSRVDTDGNIVVANPDTAGEYGAALDTFSSGEGVFNLKGIGEREAKRLDELWTMQYPDRPTTDAPHRRVTQGGGGQAAEGQTATNPTTGEKVVYRNGQWIPAT